ncbi:MAG: 2-oxoacid:acceptor oxidoreductase subunit alpha [Deltaproteobacteria bacterium]|nr:2-oxoacid:acceptor oxidoreductase subunit alpha [Deltaproteobacteria bacterium]
MEFNVLIGGEGGQGAFSVELELTEMLTGLRYHFFATKNYMSRIRGGHNRHMVRIADHAVHALSGEKWEMVIALDSDTEPLHKPELRENGIYLSRAMTVEIGEEGKRLFGEVRSANTALVGVVLAVIGVTPERMTEAAEPGKAPWLVMGHNFALRWKIAGAFPVAPAAVCPVKFDGNQALAFGALLGGCRFAAGYPMTPATSIQHYLSEAALDLPIHFEQAEDEIAAINMAVGASYAGVRSMVATAGGGFALMQEGVSLAGMTETPIVIAVAQRPGPATGLPTRTEQGDLNFILHAGHGEFPRIVFAPGCIVETIELSQKAFDLADRFQIPVFLLTDQYFADSVQVVESDRIPLDVMERPYGTFDAAYKRYRLTADGISPLTYPGLSDALVKLGSDEHDEEGKIAEDPALRKRMVEKRLSKLALLKEAAVQPRSHGAAEAATVVLSWGSNRLIVQEAAERLNAEGLPVAVLHFGQVYPLSEAMIAPYRLAEKRLICVENNATGQFAGLLKRELGLAVDRRVLKYDGDCFTVRELYQALKKLFS